MIEGVTQIATAVAGYASNLFAYFSPTRSPYYAMTVVAVVGLCWIFDADRGAWVAVFVPFSIIIITLAMMTMRSSRYLFSKIEYNDQLKFSRSLAVTTALICIVVLALNKFTMLGYPQLQTGGDAKLGCEQLKTCVPFLQWTNLIGYILCLAQISLFLAYAFLFVNFDEKIRTLAESENKDPRVVRIPEKNYVQIALIMSAYLAGFTFVTDRAKDDNSQMIPEMWTLALFGLLWLVCAAQVFLFVARNFRLEQPVDIEPLNPVATVISLKQAA